MKTNPDTQGEPRTQDTVPSFPSRSDIDRLVEQIRADADQRRAGADEPPNESIEALKADRIGAARVPAEFGGGGYSVRQLLELVMDLATADPDIPHILRAHLVFVEAALLAEVRGLDWARWLEAIRRGRIIGSAASELTHKSVGASPEHTSILVVREGVRRLSGRKFYTTGAGYSDYLHISAADEDGQAMSAIIPSDRDGIVHVGDWDGFGQTHSDSGTVIFDDVLVEDSELIEQWTPTDPAEIDRRTTGQIILHAIAAGVLRRVTQDAVEEVRRRARTYSHAASEDPSRDPQLLQIIGELSATAATVEALVLHVGDKLDAAYEAKLHRDPAAAQLQDDAAVAAARVKISVEPLALEAAANLFNVGGASVVWGSRHLDRHWRNLRTLFSHNPAVYKARLIGDLLVNGTELPRGSFF